MIELIDNEIKNENTGHSEFQIRNFIIGSQPTNYGKYKQCILELRSRSKNYKNISKEIEKINKKEEKSEEDLKRLSEYEVIIIDVEREIIIIYNILNEVKQTIDLKDRDKLETEYWNSKFEKEILAYWATGSPIPPNLAQTIWSLPGDCSVVKKLNNHLMTVKGKILIENSEEKNADS
jgi:hypothetical protein